MNDISTTLDDWQDYPESHFIESHIEQLFYNAIEELCTEHDVQIYCQRYVGFYRVDFVLFKGERRIIVECDGFEWHGSPAQLAADKKRDRELMKEGFPVLHYTGKEINDNALACAYEAISFLEVAA